MLSAYLVRALIFLLRLMANVGLPAAIGWWVYVPKYADSGGKVMIHRTNRAQWGMNRGIRRGARMLKRRDRHPRWARLICFCLGHTTPCPTVEIEEDANGATSFRTTGEECFRCRKRLGRA